MKPIAEKIVTVDARNPERRILERAADIIAKGGVVVCPTRGLYGLAADALYPEAVNRVFTLKGRDANKPLLVLIHRIGLLERLAVDITPLSRYLMDCFWPGSVTFVLSAAKGLPAGLLSPQGKIGVRLAGHPVAAALSQAVDGPITGTSANLSGRNGCSNIADLEPAVLDAVDLVLDAGPLAGGPGSTVLDATGHTPVILRQGAIAAEVVRNAFDQFTQKQPFNPE